MLEKIRNFMEIGSDILKTDLEITGKYTNISDIIIAGMGGSGIAGDIIRDFLEDVLPVPIYVCRKLTLPAFAGKNTLFISISYSGDTIETLSSLKDAMRRGCRILGITSGGQMEKIFIEKKIQHLNLPTGYPPRVALPFMLFILINVFKEMGFVKEDPNLDELKNRREEIEDAAKKIAGKLKNKMTIIYSEYQSVAHRFKSQLNENAKAPAKYDLITELCHNEINSWRSLGKGYNIIFLRDEKEHPEVKRMVEIIKELLKKSDYTEVISSGSSKLNRMLYLIWLGDFISYYLAQERKIDPEKIPATEFLKKGLSNTKILNNF